LPQAVVVSFETDLFWQDPRAPKRPSGAYIHFCREKREEAKKALKLDENEPRTADIVKELGKMWRALSEDEKKVVLSGNGSQFLGIYELDHEQLRDTAANGSQFGKYRCLFERPERVFLPVLSSRSLT
jgi:hypothetical protein